MYRLINNKIDNKNAGFLKQILDKIKIGIIFIENRIIFLNFVNLKNIST